MVEVPVKLTDFKNSTRPVPLYNAAELLKFLFDDVGIMVSHQAVERYWRHAIQAGVPWAKNYSQQPGGWPIPLKLFGDDATFNQCLGLY